MKTNWKWEILFNESGPYWSFKPHDYFVGASGAWFLENTYIGTLLRLGI